MLANYQDMPQAQVISIMLIMRSQLASKTLDVRFVQFLNQFITSFKTLEGSEKPTSLPEGRLTEMLPLQYPYHVSLPVTYYHFLIALLVPLPRSVRAFLALSSLDSCCFVVQIIPLDGCQDITPGIVRGNFPLVCAIWNGGVRCLEY